MKEYDVYLDGKRIAWIKAKDKSQVIHHIEIKEKLSFGEPKRQYKKDHMTLDDENELIARKSKDVK